MSLCWVVPCIGEHCKVKSCKRTHLTTPASKQHIACAVVAHLHQMPNPPSAGQRAGRHNDGGRNEEDRHSLHVLLHCWLVAAAMQMTGTIMNGTMHHIGTQCGACV